MKKALWSMTGLLIIASIVLAACAVPTPEVITVIETVEVEVEKIVEGEKVTVIETKEVVVTATPEPVKAMEYKAADTETLYYVSQSEGIDTLDPAWNYESEGDAAILSTVIKAHLQCSGL